MLDCRQTPGARRPLNVGFAAGFARRLWSWIRRGRAGRRGPRKAGWNGMLGDGAGCDAVVWGAA